MSTPSLGRLHLSGRMIGLALVIVASALLSTPVSSLAAPSVALSAPASVQAPDSIAMTASADGLDPSHRYWIYVRDADRQTTLALCTSGTTCSSTVSTGYPSSTSVRHFYAYVVDQNYGPGATSPTVAVEVRSYNLDVTLTGSPDQASIEIPNSVTLTATVASSVTDSGYWIYLRDDDRNTTLNLCTTGTTCSASVSFPWSTNANPAPRHFHAYVANTRTGATVRQTPVRTVYVRPHRFTVALSFGSPTTSNGSTTYPVTATFDRDLSQTGYHLTTRPSSGGGTTQCSSGVTCSFQLSTGTYRATIEDANSGAAGASYWWRLDPNQATELRFGGLDLLAGAALFPTARALCDRLLVAPGTHVADSSVTDQWLACDAAAQAGKTSLEALLAVAAVAGAVVTVPVVLMQAARDASPPGPDPTDPAPTPWPTAFPAPDTAARISRLNPDLTLENSQVETLTKECLAEMADAGQDGAQRCSELPVFASGADMPDIANHALDAIKLHPTEWSILNYEDGATKQGNRQWYTTTPYVAECTDPYLSCDEYPFWSTEQGGGNATPTPSLRDVPASQQSVQGGHLSSFRTKCGLQSAGYDRGGVVLAHGDPFISLALPPALQITTQKICNGKSG